MTQIGEAVTMEMLAPIDPFEFAARVVSVDFVDSVPVTVQGAKVAGPHWAYDTRTSYLQDWTSKTTYPRALQWFFSTKPAAYTRTGGRKVTVKVKVEKSKGVSGDGNLLGLFGALLIKGTCPTSEGEHSVDATLVGWDDAIHAAVGAIQWGLEVSSLGVSFALGPSFVELYVLLNKPARMYKNGVPAEVLRFMSRGMMLVGESTEEGVNTVVTRYAHGRHKLTYDTKQGASHYDIGFPDQAVTNFPIVKYVLRTDPTVNCYDQAAAVQCLSGAVGVAVGWIYMDPYGFINDTHLVGVPGLCNNPFFKAPGRAPTPHCDPENLKRSAFGNHAFCSYSGKILDACAGPHLGWESTSQYVDAAVDSTTTLNQRYGGFPGTASNAHPYDGVTSVDPAGA
jgi:hypothetical protein